LYLTQSFRVNEVLTFSKYSNSLLWNHDSFLVMIKPKIDRTQPRLQGYVFKNLRRRFGVWKKPNHLKQLCPEFWNLNQANHLDLVYIAWKKSMTLSVSEIEKSKFHGNPSENQKSVRNSESTKKSEIQKTVRNRKSTRILKICHNSVRISN